MVPGRPWVLLAGVLLDPAVAAALVEAGEAYSGVLLDGAPSAWVEVPREDLRPRAVDALTRLAELRQAAGDPDGALAALEQAVDADPVAEELYRRLMRLQAELGRPDASSAPTGCWPAGWPTLTWTPIRRPSGWSRNCCADLVRDQASSGSWRSMSEPFLTRGGSYRCEPDRCLSGLGVCSG